MTLNVLIVDDSSFFQRQLKNIIDQHSSLSVVGVASNGREAIDKVKKLKPDIVTMDYEMPMMDGITAVKHIMAENPLPIMMLSSMTYEGAKITLDALAAGASCFMTKNFSEISNNSPAIRKRICDTLVAIGKKEVGRSSVQTKSIDSKFLSHSDDKKNLKHFEKKTTSVCQPKAESQSIKRPKVIVIGASTGGPAALSELIKNLSPNFNLPIIIVQHMPENFTLAFAERLNKISHLSIKEGEQGDIIKNGHVYLAPGGKQFMVDSSDNSKIKIIEGNTDMNYKPSVDITFASLANSFGKNTLAIVLTGMGSDGCKGADLLKNKGANIWTQEKENCLIYGMPMAIDKANLSDGSYTIQEIAHKLNNL